MISARVELAWLRALDAVVYLWCWVAYRIVIAIPARWRLFTALLPWAGLYAYSDTYHDYLDNRDWGRSGRPKSPPLYGDEGP